MDDFQHSFNRRCKKHDYRSRCIYMITMLKTPLAPVFSIITKATDVPRITARVELTPAGKIIHDSLRQLCIDYPCLRILNHMVMPDHIHVEVFVTERTGMSLGSMLGSFKSACTSRYYTEFPQSPLAGKKLPLFTPGYNDKIAFRAGAKNAFYNYIADNPRRYLVKKRPSAQGACLSRHLSIHTKKSIGTWQ